MPCVSIIIPIYNQAGSINKCLKSIFAQTYKDFEVIVVNDGSNDYLIDVLKPWQDKIKFYDQRNKGAPKARNFGYSKSRGEYLLFCDADIILKPTMLEKMLKTLENNPSYCYAYSSFKFGWKTFKLWPFDFQKLKQMPYIHTTSLIKRECFSGFDENINKFQDWDLWLTLAKQQKYGIWINEVLFKIKAGGTMSKWLPKWLYKIKKLKQVKKYNQAKEIIKQKHGI